ncbi:N-acetylmuramoyl-L-alanine amidase [Candidatus Dojkabacteria bacterium]|jgi:N-acetylmuramoyl-L-alanine amidase|nr:N-acetylmuramoyl-L-alanine amidase [Candidatus Dojkabacteria bacterium]
MGKFICLQSGHEGRTTGSTGAPGEQELTVRIRARLSELLISKGFMVQLVNADPTTAEIDKDFDLFLALHGDADYPNDNGSGFADYPEPSTDGATVESQRICKVINDVYFPETKINYVSHSNANTRFYYMWSKLSAKTPCVLIEMGQVQDPHDRVLLANTELIAGALSKAICQAFGVVDPTPIPESPVVNPTPLEPCKDTLLLNKVKEIVFGRGYVWLKLRNLKELLG